MATKNTKIVFDVELDENHVPEKINWQSSDSGQNGESTAVLVSVWDKETANTLKIDLWTKKHTVDDMNIMFHQTLHTLGDSYIRATGNDKLAEQMKEFARFFGEETGIIKVD